MECCDYCFGHDLTKEECKELSEVFRELAEELGKERTAEADKRIEEKVNREIQGAAGESRLLFCI